MMDLRWLSKSSDGFSVGVSQLEMTGRSGYLYNLLYILGRKYNFLKLHAFLYM